MAEQNSDQMQAVIDGGRIHASDWGGEVRPRYFKKQLAAGAADDILNLCFIEAGPVRILRVTLQPGWSAFGTSRTMNLGHKAYSDIDGNEVVQNLTFFDSARSIAAAGAAVIQVNKKITARGRVDLVAQFQGGTIPVNATLEGYFEYVAN